MDAVEQKVKRPAGFWIRFIAGLVDYHIFSFLYGFIGSIIAMPAVDALTTFLDQRNLVLEELWPILFQYLLTLFPIYLALALIYYVIIPVLWNGFTIGKRIFGIHIVGTDGEKVRFWTMCLRYFIGRIIVDNLALGGFVSAIMVGVRKDKKSIHDLMAKTSVRYIK